MKKTITLSILSILFINFSSLAQNDFIYCHTDEIRINYLKQNPKIAHAVIKRDEALEQFTKSFVQNYHTKASSTSASTTSATYIIPIVVHVIHNYGNENISEAQIKDGIAILNKTFRKQRSDTASIVQSFKSIHADCDIEFRLATKDPNGNCHSGINRIASSLTALGQHDVKSLIHWPPQKYLNLYIVAGIPNLAGHCLLPADADTIPAWDGIVMAHNYMGSIGTSSPLTSVVLAHECGHYLNLQHIWGGNNVPNFYYYPCADPNKDCNIDDLVLDTPPTIGWQSCNLSGASCGNTADNVQNVMDYSYCNIMFTQGQKMRMQACLNFTVAGRNILWQTSNLIATGTYTNVAPLCKADFDANKKIICPTNQVVFANTSFAGDNITSYAWKFQGGTPATSSVANPTVTYNTSGTYSVELTVSDGTNALTTSKQNYISVQTTTGTAFPFIEGFETVTNLQGVEWLTNNMDTSTTWQLTNMASSSGSKSAMINNFSSTIDGKDELYSRTINLSGASTLNFSFKYAFARQDTTNKDQLQLFCISSCGGTNIQRFSAIGSALETTSITTSAFYPTSPTQWKQVAVTIPSFLLTNSFRFKFVFSKHGGNNIFIDDINIDINAGIDNLEAQVEDVNLFPNPANSAEGASLRFKLNTLKTLSVNIYDVLGQKVEILPKKMYEAGEHQLILPTSNLSSGMYFVQLSDGINNMKKPLVIVK